MKPNNSIDHSPSSAASSFSTSQILLRILQNLKFHYHIHKSPPLLSILSQINSVHVPRNFREIHFNIILPPAPRSSKLPSDFPTKTRYPAPPPPIRVTCFAHLVIVHLIIRIFGENYRSHISALCSCFHSPVTSSFLRRNTILTL